MKTQGYLQIFSKIKTFKVNLYLKYFHISEMYEILGNYTKIDSRKGRKPA